MSLQAPSPRLVLASGSAARRALLDHAGLAFEVMAADVDEAAVKRAGRGEGAEATALRLAAMKAQAVSARRPDALVIGADQLLVCGDAWFDKPATTEAARTQLRALRGQAHELVTAAVCVRDGEVIWQDVVRPRLAMHDFSDAALEAYLAAEGEHVTGSVGAYRLEGPGVLLFERVEGDFFAVLGLPLLSLLGFLRRIGVVFGTAAGSARQAIHSVGSRLA